MYGSILGAVICMGIAIAQDAFPAWLGTVVIISAVGCLIFPWENDMRGNPTEGTGAIQRPALLVANIVALSWLASSIGLLVGA